MAIKKAVISLVVFFFAFQFFIGGVSSESVLILGQYCNPTGGDIWCFIDDGDTYLAQSFIPQDEDFVYINLYLRRTSTTETMDYMFFMLYDDNNNKPGTMIDYYWCTLYAAGVGTSFAWTNDIVLGHTVTAGTRYWIVIKYWIIDDNDELQWRQNIPGTYPNGIAADSIDGGDTWTTYSGVDYCFKTYFRNYIPETPTASGTWTGYLNKQYSWTIGQWDDDLNENLQYRIDWGDGNGYGSWVDYTNEYNDGGYTKASKTVYHTYTSDATGTFRLQGKDKWDYTSPEYTHSVNFYNHDPTLSSGDVDPHVGTYDTTFTFEVKYTDGDNEAPVNRLCYYRIEDVTGWSWEQMTAGSGSYTSGKWYSLQHTHFPDGTGQYYFKFNNNGMDPDTYVYYPSGGSSDPLEFTVSTNAPPNPISSGDISFIPTTFYRGEEVTFHAKTTDPDGDQIRYGWSWDEDTIVDDWTGYYSSGTECTQLHTYGYNDFDGVGGETLPVVVKVKPDDGQGLGIPLTDFTSKAINLLNHDPNSTSIYGLSEIAKDVEGTWNLTPIDWETDQMWVKFNWGDGTSDTNTDWNISGYNVSASHIYTSRGLKTITCTITDEFAGSRVIYKTITIEDVPGPPLNIRSIAYHQRIHVFWNKPSDDGGEPVNTYGIKWWNASKTEDTAEFMYEISYLNASEYDNTGHNLTELDNDQQYNFRISANNTYGMSAWSNTCNNTPGHTPPTAPVLQPLPEYSGATLDLEWSEPTFYDGAVIDKYYVLNSTDNIVYYGLGNTTQRTYHVTNLENGLTYYFKVYAIDDQSGQSPNSNYRYTFIDDINPNEPILNNLPVYTYGLSIDISWSASTDSGSGIDYYILQEDDSTSFDNIINTYESTNTNVTFFSNHIYSKTYYFRVKAYDKAGNPSIWNGPVQTTLKTNTTIGTEYSKITEIWFNRNNIIINSPVLITITVEDKYSIPSGFTEFSSGGVATEMRLSGVGAGHFKFSGVWLPTVSGNTEITIKVVNENNAVTYINVPVEISSTNKSTDIETILVFESTDEDIVVATFSETSLNVSAYQDVSNIYHVGFGTQPSKPLIDLTNLEADLEVAYILFFRVSWLDRNVLKCMVHGNRKIIQYKFNTQNFEIDGYNDLVTKLFSWIIGTDYDLNEQTTTTTILSSIQNFINVKY